ncbi:hypothetical protein SISNIDRAFT_389314, partial [Sistotremastrum niveocremeum HHB9708]
DLIIRTRDGVDFRVHRSLLSLASRVFRDMLTLDQTALPSSSPIHVVDVSEVSAHLEAILRYLYPYPSPVLTSLDQLVVLLEIADKYEFSVIMIALEDVLVTGHFWKTDNIRAFGVSRKFKLTRWQAVVEPELLKQPYHVMHSASPSSEEDAVTAEDLRRFDWYRNHRVSAAVELL